MILPQIRSCRCGCVVPCCSCIRRQSAIPAPARAGLAFLLFCSRHSLIASLLFRPFGGSVVVFCRSVRNDSGGHRLFPAPGVMAAEGLCSGGRQTVVEETENRRRVLETERKGDFSEGEVRWRTWRGSNPQSSPPEGDALSIRLQVRVFTGRIITACVPNCTG